MINNFFSISLVVCLFGTLVFFYKIYDKKHHEYYFFENSMLNVQTSNVEELATLYGNNNASSVWCLARIDKSKLCYFKNLYYFPELKDYVIFILNENSTVSGIESQNELKSINLSSVKNLTSVNLKLILVKSFKSINIRQQPIEVIEKKTLILQRFKPDNIMHVIHDDLLPIYFTLYELCKGDVDHCLSSYQLTFIDNFGEGPFSKWYDIFSNHKPTLLKDSNTALCIKESVVGLTKESVWFQYGYKHVHGPVPNTQFNGLRLNEFSHFIKYQLKIERGRQSSLLDEESVVLINREINRRILNVKFLENNLKQLYFHLKNRVIKVVSLDLSTNDSVSVVQAIQKTNLLIGMHGSAMMLAIFLPEHSDVIELFPFGIQPNFVSPLKALCSLPNISFRYNMWVNENETNSITHPEAHPLVGGIRHLPLDEQVTIENTKLVPPVECCHNPLYLFRMFQDTIVDNSFNDLLRKVVTDRMMKSEAISDPATHDLTYNHFLFPPPVFNLTCQCLGGSLKISWTFPFTITGITFSVATSNGKLLETESLHLSIEEDRTCKTAENAEVSSNHESSVVSVWVKTLQDDQESLDSYSKCD